MGFLIPIIIVFGIALIIWPIKKELDKSNKK
jgi:hypothetical protein